MRSMTGFGAARITRGELEVNVELRSVNHRYADIKLHLPPALVPHENRLESSVRRVVERGRVEASVELSDRRRPAESALIDLERARAYAAAFDRAAEALGYAARPSLELVLQAPGVIRAQASPDAGEEAIALAEEALALGARALGQMREREGAALAAELTRLLGALDVGLDRIRELLPRAAAERRERMEQRVRQLLGEQSVDPARLAQELALLADRSDITEELTRLTSHLAQFRHLIQGPGAIGRKLDFLLQEMGREVNTLGAKVGAADIGHVVVELKAELERLREQVQNVE